MKKYQIIYADPPWNYEVWSEDKKQAQGVAKRYYPTMKVGDICSIPVRDIADKDCKLFLWATPPCLPEALEVMKAWGFEYKTIVFAWVKLNKTANPNQQSFVLQDSIPRFYGIGHWTASNLEIVLGGLQQGGLLHRQAKDISQIVLSPLTVHSAKPPEIREKIVKLCGDVPRIELFARQKTEGWDVWGNEVESDIELSLPTQ
jgi:site-specific DNA-methyltransferase (adenine-specific)